MFHTVSGYTPLCAVVTVHGCFHCAWLLPSVRKHALLCTQRGTTLHTREHLCTVETPVYSGKHPHTVGNTSTLCITAAHSGECLHTVGNNHAQWGTPVDSENTCIQCGTSMHSVECYRQWGNHCTPWGTPVKTPVHSGEQLCIVGNTFIE